jgi:hypothetical protein
MEMTVDWAIQRLQKLRDEYTSGENQLAQLDRRRVQLQDGLLQTAGAIQILEELIAASGTFDADPEAVATIQQ